MEYVRELAFMTREEQEAMLAVLGLSIDWGGVKPSKRPHPRKGISRYESYWPAQSATCSACGEMVYSDGAYLRCGNSFPHLDGTCWNHVRVPIAPLRGALADWLVKQCNRVPGFQEVLLDAVQRQLHCQQSRRADNRDALAAKTKDLEAQERNLRRSIRVTSEIAEEDLKALVADLASVTRQLREVRQDVESATTITQSPADVSDDQIVGRLAEVIEYLLGASFEMAEVARNFVPHCVIVPVQSLDTGQVYARAKLTLRGNMQDYEAVEELVVDAFEPPHYIRIVADAVALRSQEPRPTLKQIGAALKANYMTVKRALAYDRLMKDLGVTEPFRELYAKPDNASRWRHAS